MEFSKQRIAVWSVIAALGGCEPDTIDALESALEVTPATLDFGRAEQGAPLVRALTFKNRGEATLTAVLEVADAPFSPVKTELILPPNAIEQIDVRFEPNAAGHYEARLEIAADTRAPTAIEIPLRGQGARCALSTSPTSLEYVAPIQGWDDRVVSIENRGFETCALSVPIEEGESLFRVLRRPPRIVPEKLAPGERAEITVRYEPTDEVPDTGWLLVHSDDAEDPVDHVELHGDWERGFGCHFDATETEIELPLVPTGQEIRTGVAVDNLGRNDPCVVTIALEAGTDPEFSLEQTSQLVLPETRGVFPLRFQRVGEGLWTAKVLLRAEGSEHEERVTVRSGAGPALCVSPDTLHFDGEPGQKKSITLHACAGRDVRVERIALEHASFRVEGEPLVLARGVEVRVEVEYLRVGEASAVLKIDSDDEFSPERRVRISSGGALPAPAGRFVYDFGDEASGMLALYRTTLQGSPETELIYSPRATSCFGCHEVSPDGRYLAFIDVPDNKFGQPERFRLHVLDLSTGNEIVPPDFPAKPLSFSFRPDTDTSPPYQLVYANGEGDLRLFSLFGGELGPLEGASGPDYDEAQPSWGPEGQIVFVRTPPYGYSGFTTLGPSDLMIIDENGGAAKAVLGASDNGAANFYPAWSPVGGFIAYAESRIALGSHRSLAPDARVRLVRSDGSGMVVDLPAVEKMGSTTPTFSLDGMWLGFASWGRIYVVTFDPVTGKTGSPEVLTREERTAFWPRFSR